MTHPINLLE